MNVEYGLPGPFIAVHDDPVTRLGQTFPAGDFFGGEKQFADGLPIVFVKIIDR